MSKQRVRDITTTVDDVIVTLEGVPGEFIVFTNFLNGIITRHECVFGSSGKAHLSLSTYNNDCVSD